MKSANLDDHVAFLLDNIELNLDKLRDLVGRNKLTWKTSCFLDSPEEKREELLSSAIFERAAEFGIPIEVEDFSGITLCWAYPPPAS